MPRLLRDLILLLVLVALPAGLAACTDTSPAVAPTVAATQPAAPSNTPVPIPRPTETATSVARTMETPGPSAFTQEVDEYLNKLVKQRAFSGVVLLAREGKVVHLKGYGMADAEKGVPNTPETAFQIGSMTKAFTAASILLLQEQGKLSVQEPACKYLPGCPPEWQVFTIHHLLSHTSGIPDPVAPGGVVPPGLLDMSFEQVFEMQKLRPLDFEPGSKFVYSDAGYGALGHIIEQVSGEKYADFVGKHILAPLGMTHSSFGAAASGGTSRAVGYREPGKPIAAGTSALLAPVGGLFSTAEDIFLWDQSLYTEKLLSKASLDAAFTPNLEDYGYGWRIKSDGAFGKLITHSGQMPGFASAIDRYVDTRSTVLVLSNYETANVASNYTYIGSELAFMLFKQR